MSSLLRCPNCEGSGKNYQWRTKREQGRAYQVARKVRCWVCVGKKKVTWERWDEATLIAVRNAAQAGYVFLVDHQGLKAFGHYQSPRQKVLKETRSFLVIETWWSNKQEKFSRQTGWKQGVRVEPRQQRTTWRVAEASITAWREKELS